MISRLALVLFLGLTDEAIAGSNSFGYQFDNRQTADESPKSEVRRRSSHMCVSLSGSLDYGRYAHPLDRALTWQGAGSLGLGIRFDRLAVIVSGSLGGARLSNEFIGTLDLGPPDTHLVHVANTSITMGYSVIAAKKVRITPKVGLKWNVVSTLQFEDTEIEPDNKLGVVAGIQFDYNVARIGQAGDIERTHHSVFLSLSASHWDYSVVGWGSGTLWTLSVGYVVDIVVL